VSTRTLVILRHAKAANPDGMPDADRPLTERGHADAAAAGAWLLHSGLMPDLVLCSPARRTRQTWHGVATVLPSAPVVRYERTIYAASARTLLATLQSSGEEAAAILLIGHNPGVSDLSALLDPERADADGLRTAGIAVHTVAGSWTDLGSMTAQLNASHTARTD
jgi:phosphohistidine phosphatase